MHGAAPTENCPPDGGCGGGFPGRLAPTETPRSPFPNNGALERRPLSMPEGTSVQFATYLAAVSTPLFLAPLLDAVDAAEMQIRRNQQPAKTAAVISL